MFQVRDNHGRTALVLAVCMARLEATKAGRNLDFEENCKHSHLKKSRKKHSKRSKVGFFLFICPCNNFQMADGINF